MPNHDRDRRVPILFEDGLEIDFILSADGKRVGLSCMVGCPLGCRFCAASLAPYLRNVTQTELQLQLETARRMSMKVEQVWFDGCGEPLHNLDAVAPFIRDLQEEGLEVFVCTTAPRSRLVEYTKRVEHVQTIVSLHGTVQAHQPMPVRRSNPPAEVVGAVLQHIPNPVFRYLVIPGVNDHPSDMQQLCVWLGDSGVQLQLSAVQAVGKQQQEFPTASSQDLSTFAAQLSARGVNVCLVEEGRLAGTVRPRIRIEEAKVLPSKSVLSRAQRWERQSQSPVRSGGVRQRTSGNHERGD